MEESLESILQLLKWQVDPAQTLLNSLILFNEVNKDPSLKDTWQRFGSQTAWTDGGV